MTTLLKEKALELKIRTVYFKVTNMEKAARFWRAFLQKEPVKSLPQYHEWKIQQLNFGLVLNDFGDKYSGSNCVPVFELDDAAVLVLVERAKSLGATVILDGLDNPALLSVVMADPWGNEFEVSKFHD